MDAKFFGEIIKLPSIETKKVKHVLTQKQQYQDGHDLITLTDTSESFSDAEQDGGSTANAVSDTETTTHGTTHSSGTNDSTTRVAEAVSNARSDQSGHSQQSGSNTSQASARGTTQTQGNNWSRTKTRGANVTRKQTLVPRILTREVVTAIQFYTTDEQIVEAASELTRLIRGTCFLYVAGQGVSRVQIPADRDPLAGLPRFVAKKLVELRRQVLARPEFDTPANLHQKRIEFERKLIEFLASVPHPALRNIAEEAPLLIVPENTDNKLIVI